VPRLTVVVLSSLVSLSGVLLIAHHEFGSTGSDVQLESAAPPSAAAAQQGGSSPGSAATSGSVAADAVPPATPDLSGVPVEVVIPIATSNHPDGVRARITSDPLLPNGDLFVPDDPRIVSWANEDAMPGATYGTAIITGHVNYPVDGRQVVGAFSDLAELSAGHMDERFGLVLADGRTLEYVITGGVQYDKDQLAADPDLRRELYDQDNAFGSGAGSGRLLLVSCGGAFDNSTGNYEDNIFLFAMPVG
jgi:hypothetical protein